MRFFDGKAEIIFFSEFIIYEGFLRIQDLMIDEEKHQFEFEFVKRDQDKTTGLSWKGDSVTKTLKVTLINFTNSLGTGTTKRVSIMENKDKNFKISIAIHAKSLNETTQFLLVSMCFYKEPLI
jgi:hypothetical protein